jgi:hypothetical protein
MVGMEQPEELEALELARGGETKSFKAIEAIANTWVRVTQSNMVEGMCVCVCVQEQVEN